ncbi:MAG: hypothetical protein KF800_15270 [Lysobacter sp.]|nr:hypothetical protein [Lysobacter sp.]
MGQGSGPSIRATGAHASPQERAELTRRFVSKWSAYVQRVYGVQPNVWARRIGPSLGTVDGDNLRNALSRDTFEGAMAELTGDGARLSDAQMQAKMSAMAGDKVLGALGNDLVYTPIQPCRIVDTRVAGGAIAANSTRSFVGINASNFTSQGGSATNCGTLGLSATALALNTTAVSPSIAGYATVFPYGTAQPLASSVNYTAGAVVNNAIIAQVPNPLASYDFTIYSFAQSHYVVDIVGYFAPPVATALQCVETPNTDLVITANGGTGNATAPACPVGYTQTSTNCETTSWLMPIVYFQSGTCSARNGDTINQTLRASRTCCRVPGR